MATMAMHGCFQGGTSGYEANSQARVRLALGHLGSACSWDGTCIMVHCAAVAAYVPTVASAALTHSCTAR